MGCYGCGSEFGSESKLCPECAQKKQREIEHYRHKSKKLLEKYEAENPQREKRFRQFKIALAVCILPAAVILYYGVRQIYLEPVKVEASAGDLDPAKKPCPPDSLKKEAGQCGCNEPDADSDADGTADCKDLCPDDPKKIDPGWCGCLAGDEDRDADGIPDCKDTCPDDPRKTAPGACGCGRVDIDTDGDGIMDCDDNCPFAANRDQADTDANGIGDRCERESLVSASACLAGSSGGDIKQKSADGKVMASVFQFSVPGPEPEGKISLSGLDKATSRVNVRAYKYRSDEEFFNKIVTLPGSLPLTEWEKGNYELGIFESTTSSQPARGRFCIKVLDSQQKPVAVRVVEREVVGR